MCLSWFLAEDGVDVLCIDSGRNSGSTANAGSMHVQMQSRLERLYPERTRRVRADVMALSARRQNLAGVGRVGSATMSNCGSRADSWWPRTTSRCVRWRENARGKIATGSRRRVLDRGALQRVAPYLADAYCGATFCELEGKVNPLLANSAIEQRALAGSGVVLRRETRGPIDRSQNGWRPRSRSSRASTAMWPAGSSSQPAPVAAPSRPCSVLVSKPGPSPCI